MNEYKGTTQDGLAESIIKRFEDAESKRANWVSHWEEIARIILPAYVDSFTNRGTMSRSKGEKRTDEMVDATGALALPKFAAVRESMLTPRNTKWHRLQALDPNMRRNRNAKLWFEEVNEILFRYRYQPKANFAGQNYEVGMSLGAFGTGVMFIDPLDRRYGQGLRYKAVHLAEVFFMENHQGIIDTAIRRFELTARQAAQRFGEEMLPEDIQKAMENEKDRDKPFSFLHCVKPREEEDGYDEEQVTQNGMLYVSYYVSETGKKVVREGGYNTFPYAIDRYVQAPGETYGRSPAMMALPSLKTLNEQKKSVLKQGHRATDPVLLAHDDGIIDGFNLTPGSVNFGGVSAEGRPLVHTLPTGNIAVGDRMMEMERLVINDAFLITLFQILVETPAMTATEVLERSREKGALLSPTMGRSQTEYLGPMIERELDVLSQQGLLPEMPQVLLESMAEYEAVYDSPLSRAQRAEEATGLMRLVDWTTQSIQITGDPSALDWIDWDSAMPDLADISAVPNRWMRGGEAVMAIREQRAQQAQQQQMLDAAPAAAGVMKAMGGAGQ